MEKATIRHKSASLKLLQRKEKQRALRTGCATVSTMLIKWHIHIVLNNIFRMMDVMHIYQLMRHAKHVVI